MTASMTSTVESRQSSLKRRYKTRTSAGSCLYSFNKSSISAYGQVFCLIYVVLSYQTLYWAGFKWYSIPNEREVYMCRKVFQRAISFLHWRILPSNREVEVNIVEFMHILAGYVLYVVPVCLQIDWAFFFVEFIYLILKYNMEILTVIKSEDSY